MKYLITAGILEHVQIRCLRLFPIIFTKEIAKRTLQEITLVIAEIPGLP